MLESDRQNDDLEAAFANHTEVPIDGPSRVQVKQGLPADWNLLDRVWFIMPQADGADMVPEAKTLYNSRLAFGSLFPCVVPRPFPCVRFCYVLRTGMCFSGVWNDIFPRSV